MTDANTDAPGPSGWLPLKDAATAYGVSLRTMQRRVAAREVECMRVKTAKGREWRIRPPGPNDTTGSRHDAPEPTAAPVSDTTALAVVRDALESIVADQARLRAEVDRLQEARLADAQAASAARMADAETIGHLRGRLEATEAALARLRSAEAPAPPAAAPTTRRRWPWQKG